MAPVQKKLPAHLQAMIDDLAKDSTPSDVIFLKEGSSYVKLAMPAGRRPDESFYQKFISTFSDGSQSTYYLIAGVIVAADADGVADPNKVVYIKVPKTVILDIINHLSKKWQLFATRGPVFEIGRIKNGKKTDYRCGIDPDEDTFFSLEGRTWPETSIEESALDQENRDREKSNGGSGGKSKSARGEDLA